jgi:cytochrome c553
MKSLNPRFLSAIWVATLVGVASPAFSQTPERARQCVACHGEQGISSTPTIPSLAGQPKLFLENQLVLIREGIRDIPTMKGQLDGLDDAALSSLAGYFSALPAPTPTDTHIDKKRFERGRDLANTTRCNTCHLPNYSGREQVPRLSGQPEQFLFEAMKQFRDSPGPGRDTTMSAAVFGMKDDALADLAYFLARYSSK